MTVTRWCSSQPSLRSMGFGVIVVGISNVCALYFVAVVLIKLPSLADIHSQVRDTPHRKGSDFHNQDTD